MSAPDTYDGSNGLWPPDDFVVSRNKDGSVASVYSDLKWNIMAYSALGCPAKLEDLEYVLVHRGGRGQSFVYELLYDGQGRDGKPFLMGLVDVEQLKKHHYGVKKGHPSSPQGDGPEPGCRPLNNNDNALNKAASLTSEKKPTQNASSDETTAPSYPQRHRSDARAREVSHAAQRPTPQTPQNKLAQIEGQRALARHLARCPPVDAVHERPLRVDAGLGLRRGHD